MANSRDDDVKPAHSVPNVPAVQDTKRLHFPIVVAASLLLTVVVACTSQSPDSTTTARPAPSTADRNAADSLKALETQVDGLADRVREIDGRIGSEPRSEPADLAPLRNKIDEIARSTEGVASITKAVDSLEGRIGALEKSIADLRSQLASLRSQGQPSASGARPATEESSVKKPARPVPPRSVRPSRS